MMKMTRWTDDQVERIIGGLLQIGVLLSGFVVLIGGVFYLVQYGDRIANYRTFRAERAQLHAIGPVISAAVHLDGGAVIQVGLLLLIATPVARVVFSVFAFAMQNDRVYVSITLAVLAVLLFSLFGGA
jgi:uncharacterized membrane protein